MKKKCVENSSWVEWLTHLQEISRGPTSLGWCPGVFFANEPQDGEIKPTEPEGKIQAQLHLAGILSFTLRYGRFDVTKGGGRGQKEVSNLTPCSQNRGVPSS